MTLQPGTRLGVYEVIAPLGAGGMGEVYRARDTRIGREVAIKVLPPAVAEDRERLSRFQREAQAAGALNHPNLLTIHELGVDGGGPYLVSELLEGTTLRERVSGSPLSSRKAIDYALQISSGLAAAHEKGIVHRDLKPENIFVTRDGRVKILDFGLAKVQPVSSSVMTAAPTAALETDPGAVVGTVGYMSPEQVRGEHVDHRTDIFSLGAILYEMLSGRRAFRASSSVDTMHAILHDEPPEMSGSNPQITPALERVVQHCLEKNPEERFQSARDLAFDLETISGASGSAPAIPLTRRERKRAFAAAAITAAIVAAGVVGWLAASRLNRPPVTRFQRLTFRSTTISGARFVPGQQSIVLSSLIGVESDLSMVTPGHPELRSLNAPKSLLLSVSRSGEMAILMNARLLGGFIIIGTLARVPVGGGAPREIAEDIQWAEWMPSGDDMLVLRTLGGKSRLEKPIGTVLYGVPGWISSPRPSPDGKSIAFIEHPISGDDAGFISLLTSDHQKRVLSQHFNSAQGLAWSPDGREIWFTAAITGSGRSLYAVSPQGRERLLASSPNALTLFDTSTDGRALVSESNSRNAIFAHLPGGAADRDLTWLDWSVPRDLTADGQLVLFDESGEGGGENYSVYTRRLDGSPAVRLGDGIAQRFSPDGRSALAIHSHAPIPQIFSYPIGPGETRQITNDNITHVSASFMPDGRQIVFIGHEPNHGNRIYLQDLTGGKPRPVTAEGILRGPRLPLVSPDGTSICARDGDGRVAIFSLTGRPTLTLNELQKTDTPMKWTADGKGIIYFRRSMNPVPVFKIDISSRSVEKMIELPLPPSLYGIGGLMFSADDRSYIYNPFLESSDLFLLEGIK